MTVKLLERLVGKLRSIHLVVPGAIGNFYAMQVAFTCSMAANRATAYLLARFHQDVHFWRELCEVMDTRPT